MQLAFDFRPLLLRQAAHGRRNAAPSAGQPLLAPAAADLKLRELARHACMFLERPQGRVLECLEGCLWITLDGEVRDVILDAGQRFQPDSGRRLIVQALVPSRLRIDDVT